MNTPEVMQALRRRYSGSEWAFLAEVPDGTGMAKTRSADGMAMNLYPSRGLELHGFEIKVSRGDWLKEVKTPDKAEAFVQYCDRWWIVAGDPDIVKLEELPPTWGLIVPRGKDLVQKVAAPKLNPVQIDRCFLAGLLRRATEQLIPADEKAEEVRRARSDGYDDGKRHAEIANKHTQDALSRLKEQVDAFEKVSGIKITQWGCGNVASIVRDIKQAEECRIAAARWRSELSSAEILVSHLRDLVAELDTRSSTLAS